MEGLELARYRYSALYLDSTVMLYWITDQTGSVAGGEHAKVKDMFTDHHFSHHHNET
jgi:hypothetical protein